MTDDVHFHLAELISNVRGTHIYLSTACQHDEHGLCRRTCKYCSAKCRCDCHQKN